MIDDNQDLMESLEGELEQFNHQFMELAVEVLRNDISKYPILFLFSWYNGVRLNIILWTLRIVSM